MDLTTKQVKCFVLTCNEAPIFVFFDEDDAEKHYEDFILGGAAEAEYGLKVVAGQPLSQLLRSLADGKMQFFEPLAVEQL